MGPTGERAIPPSAVWDLAQLTVALEHPAQDTKGRFRLPPDDVVGSRGAQDKSVEEGGMDASEHDWDVWAGRSDLAYDVASSRP